MKLMGDWQRCVLVFLVVHGLLTSLFAPSGIESEIVNEAEPIEVIKGLQLPVARVGHLIALKLLARDDATRPQDSVYIRALLKEADDQEIALARGAISLIESRGYARGRDLKSDLDKLLERS